MKADSGDLQDEAKRTGYRMQLRQRPFHEHNQAEDRNWVDHKLTEEEVKKSVEHLRDVTLELDPRAEACALGVRSGRHSMVGQPGSRTGLRKKSNKAHRSHGLVLEPKGEVKCSEVK